MQRRIEELAAGKFDRQSTLLQFTPEKLEIEVLEGTVYTGEFTLTSVEGIPVVGTICSTSPRMKCPEEGFEGVEITMQFEFHSEGLFDGDSQTGSFHIISDQGEYALPFSVSVCKHYPNSTQGKVKSVFEFANLAHISYDEAVKVFSQPEFASVFTPREDEERLILRGLRRRPCTRTQVEEFLIASRKKKRVLFEVEEAENEFYGVTETQKQQIVIKKEIWGHYALEVTSDGDMIQPLKSRITDEDFVGSRGTVEYLIHADKLHPGRNYGRLTLQTPFQKEEINICVSKDVVRSIHPIWEIRHKQARLAKDYIRFGTHKMVNSAWAKQTCRHIEELQEIMPDDLWYFLAKAQVYFVSKQRQKAEWILNSFPRNKVDKESPLYAYYLYLSALKDPEQSYINKCTGKIRKIYNKHREDPVLLWILLYLDEELNYSKGRKLETIARYLRRGHESILLYLEAFRIYEKEPYLLNRISEFEQKVLNFTVKHQAMTRQIAEQVVKLAPEIPVDEPVWYKILSACYEAAPGREALQALCSYCIKGQRYGREYWKWYQLGVTEELRIAGLHEAWVRSADKEQMAKLPKQIVHYFQAYHNFAGEAEALFYQTLIENKSQWKNVWPHYSKNIREFALKQMQAGRVDRALAAVYKEVLTPDLLTRENAGDMAKVLFACEVFCDNPNVRNLVLCQHVLEKEQIAPVVHGKAYVNIYCSSWKILLEDARGRRFVPDEELKVTPLFDSGDFLKQGIACAKDKLPYLLKYFDKKKIWQTYEEEDLGYLQVIVDSPEISEEYRRELRPQMVAYYYDNYTGDALDEFLTTVSYEGIGSLEREKIIRLLVARRHYKRVYELILDYGIEHIPPSKLIYVITYRMDELEREEQEGPDVFLMKLCREVFMRGKYNERILIYLCKYFEGALSEMLQIWEAACDFELNTYMIEERCMKRCLYTGDFSSLLEKVFESYVRNVGNDLVIQAYLSRMAYQYVVHDAIVSEFVFRRIAGILGSGGMLNPVCRLGFLKWCALKQRAEEQEWKTAETVLEELVRNGCYFAFFKSLPRRLQEKYMFHDLEIIEYHTRPQAKVYIDYLPAGSTKYTEREMKQVYDGIYAKEFLVFYEENIPYYIKEEIDGESRVTESGQVERRELADAGEESRPVRIDDMMAAWQMRDEVTLLRQLRDYGQRDEMVKRQFTLM